MKHALWQPPGGKLERLYSHKDNQCAAQRCKRLPVYAWRCSGALLMSRHDGDRRRKGTMRHRYSRVRGYGNGRTHAGDHLEWNTCMSQCQGFFTATPKDERVSTFQAHHQASLPRIPNEKSIDLLLIYGVMPGRFTNIHPFRLS